MTANRFEQQGRDDYLKGVQRSENPYRWTSHKNNGPAKSDAWAAGWEKAKMETKT